MTLRTRIQLMITSLLVATVLVVAILVTVSARKNILEQAGSDGLLITEQLGHAASVGEMIRNELLILYEENAPVTATTDLAQATGSQGSLVQFALRYMSGDMWIGQFAEPAIGHGLSAVWWVDRNYNLKLFRVDPKTNFTETLSPKDREMLQRTMDEQRPLKYQDGKFVKAASYTTDAAGEVTGGGLLAFPTSLADRAFKEQLLITVIVAALSLVLGLLVSTFLARRVTRPVVEITAAAAAVEAEAYDSESLAQVAERPDELGQLARVFRRMAQEVVLREQRLKQQVQELRIEVDNAKKAKQVQEITESEFFQDLQQRANRLRSAQRVRKAEAK
jgi:HAMP domain-containing protein